MPRLVGLSRAALALGLAAALAGCPADDETRCPAGQTACGGVCFDLQTDPLSCGGCLRTCPTGAECLAGACRCPAGQQPCDGACVDVQTDAAHCGACGQACGLGTCVTGACACDPGASGCPGSPACVDLAADPAHCGACGTRCLTRGVCAGGTCGCAGAFPDACDTYCASFASTTDCGTCGNACAAGGVCDTTVTPAACGCPGAEIVCGDTGASPGACVDTATDEANCGGCGAPCALGATCTAGTCACPSGQTACGASPGRCVDRLTDETNCGACGTSCPTGATCTSGTCLCPTGQPQACGGTCCAGDQCCGTGGSACQPAHSNGLGQSYFLGCTLFAPAQTTREAALRAAAAWRPDGVARDGTTSCGPACVGQEAGNQCAVWCYGESPVAGLVNLNSLSALCVCPSPGSSPGWN